MLSFSVYPLQLYNSRCNSCNILLHTVPEYTKFPIFCRSNRLQYLCTTLQALNGYTKFYNYIKTLFNIMHYSVAVRKITLYRSFVLSIE